MKKSAGILAYKQENKKILVLLAHFGGPYWNKRDTGGWSIPKGQYEREKPLNAGIREFEEETGFKITASDFLFLASIKQNSQKLVTIFAIKEDFDATKLVSNTFELEWPKNSGKIQSFPEMDCGKWFAVEEAKEKIVKGQLKFLEKLEEILKE